MSLSNCNIRKNFLLLPEMRNQFCTVADLIFLHVFSRYCIPPGVIRFVLQIFLIRLFSICYATPYCFTPVLIRDKFTSLIFFWQRSITAHCREPVSPITVFSSFFRDCYVLSPSMGLSESPEFHTSTRTSPFSYQGSIKINKGKHLFRLNFS